MKEHIAELNKSPSEHMLPTPHIITAHTPEVLSDEQIALLNSEGLSLDRETPTDMSPEGFYRRFVELSRENVTDELTGLLNRRGMNMWFERYKPEAFIVLFADGIDFGKINKEHGHDVGDEVIRRIGSDIAGKFRLKDSEAGTDRRKRVAYDAAGAVMRWGGDEFMIVADISAVYRELKNGSMNEEEYTVEVSKIEEILEDRLKNFGEYDLSNGKTVGIGIRSDSVVGYGKDGFDLDHYHNHLVRV